VLGGSGWLRESSERRRWSTFELVCCDVAWRMLRSMLVFPMLTLSFCVSISSRSEGV
jgi:hypothetical protein